MMMRVDPIGFDSREWFVQKIVNRINRDNLNAIIGFFGTPGKGKSYASFDLCEELCRRFGLPFGIENIHFQVEDFMHQLNSLPPRGTPIILDDAELDANSQKWWTEASQTLAMVGASGRFLGYLFIVSAPDSEMLTGQFRRQFHYYFEIKKKDRDRKLAIAKPQQPYRDWKTGKIRGKYLRAYTPEDGEFKVEEVLFHLPHHATGAFNKWPGYEDKKADYLLELYRGQEQRLIAANSGRIPAWSIRALKRLHLDHPEWSNERLGQEVGIRRQQVGIVLQRGE